VARSGACSLAFSVELLLPLQPALSFVLDVIPFT
jgi:hypothetical protein